MTKPENIVEALLVVAMTGLTVGWFWAITGRLERETIGAALLVWVLLALRLRHV